MMWAIIVVGNLLNPPDTVYDFTSFNVYSINRGALVATVIKNNKYELSFYRAVLGEEEEIIVRGGEDFFYKTIVKFNRKDTIKLDIQLPGRRDLGRIIVENKDRAKCRLFVLTKQDTSEYRMGIPVLLQTHSRDTLTFPKNEYVIMVESYIHQWDLTYVSYDWHYAHTIDGGKPSHYQFLAVDDKVHLLSIDRIDKKPFSFRRFCKSMDSQLDYFFENLTRKRQKPQSKKRPFF